ncbi:MAG TPA: hypothetical protein VFB36_08240 [Nevskiaceae bacterium]|nr:hypothetical protein [Nevskiaceae bacterium]
MILSRTLAAATLCALFAGCGMLKPKCDCPRDEKSGEKVDEKGRIDPKSGLPRQRVILNEGYSELYHDATSIDRSELIVYVKDVSPPVAEILRGVAAYADRLKEEMERLAGEYPAVKIDLAPLPEMEMRKRRAIALDRAKEFAPLVGKGGLELDRTILQSLDGGLNHQAHMSKVLAEEEPEPGLKKFLIDTQQHYEAWDERVKVLLERDYFRQPKTR